MEEKLKKMVEQEINNMTSDGLKPQDLEVLSKLVDVHKDLENEEYWKVKKEAIEMRYNRGYGEYGDYESYGEYGRRGVPGTGRSYGRRGVPGTGRGRRYRGEEMMNEMHGAYRDYSEGKEEVEMGNYGAKNDTMKSLDYMMQSVVQFIEMLKKDAASQEEMELIQNYAHQISEM